MNLGPQSCKIAIKCKILARIFKDLHLTSSRVHNQIYLANEPRITHPQSSSYSTFYQLLISSNPCKLPPPSQRHVQLLFLKKNQSHPHLALPPLVLILSFIFIFSRTYYDPPSSQELPSNFTKSKPTDSHSLQQTL